jgi:hypothetical protein
MHDAPILDAIEPDVTATLLSRREAIVKSGKASGLLAAGLAIGSMPVALAALSREAYGQAPSSVLDVLQFALLLENLEAEFYKAVTGESGVPEFNDAFAPVRATITPVEAATFALIRDHERAHVTFLQRAIALAGGSPRVYDARTTFDFTGGRGSGTGPFLPATRDKNFLLAAAQAFEDTGVRAYKGQAGNLLGTGDVLQAALQIHSVEARHAAKIRRMRRLANSIVTPDVRLSGGVEGEGHIAAGVSNVASLPAAVSFAFFAVYHMEGNQRHTVNNGTSDVTLDAATLPNLVFGPDVSTAFDEPLNRGQVVQIVQPFLIPTVF